MKKNGFTLVEVLVVLIIISILATVSLPSVKKARTRAGIMKTKAMISSIETALSMYHTDLGNYPESTGSSVVLIEALMEPIPNEENWKGPYMRFKQKDIDENKNIIDTWGNPLRYIYPQNEKSNVPFIIVSSGPDKKLNTADDIGNW